MKKTKNTDHEITLLGFIPKELPASTEKRIEGETGSASYSKILTSGI